MNRLFMPSHGPSYWRRLLANPAKQWKRGHSAMEMAISWESAQDSDKGIPSEVIKVLDSCSATQGAELLFAVPEHSVGFAGRGHQSQNDLWALMAVGPKLMSVAVEAKSGESFRELVKDWLPEPGTRSEKPGRLTEICSRLNITEGEASIIRYQLLHRAASALKEAERFHAIIALLLIQSFAGSRDRHNLKAFKEFASLMGADVTENSISLCKKETCPQLLMGWVDCAPADEKKVFAAI